MYEVKKQFVSGSLVGLTVKVITPVFFPVGFHCVGAIGGSDYIVIARKKVK